MKATRIGKVYPWDENSLPKPLVLALEEVRRIDKKGETLCPEYAFEMNFLVHFLGKSHDEVKARYPGVASKNLIKKTTTLKTNIRGTGGKRESHWDEVKPIWAKCHEELKVWDNDSRAQVSFTLRRKLEKLLSEFEDIREFRVKRQDLEKILDLVTLYDMEHLIEKKMFPRL